MADTINFTSLGLTGTGLVVQNAPKSFNKFSVGSPGFAVQKADGTCIVRSIIGSSDVPTTNPTGSGGDVGISLSDTGVTPGTYFGAILVDAKGRITFASNIIDTSSGAFEVVSIKQPSGFTNGNALQQAAGVQTTDATATPIISIIVAEGESITVSGSITGAKDDHTQAVGGRFQVTARRASGGNVTLIGAAQVNVQSSSTATFTCDVDVGSQAVRVLVTGVVANTYNWTTNYIAQRVKSNT